MSGRSAGMLARISALVHTGPVPISRELAADLAAAWLDRRSYHHDLCAGPCSCGIDRLLTSLVDALLPGFTDAAKRLGLEGKPFWPADYPGLLQGLAAAL